LPPRRSWAQRGGPWVGQRYKFLNFAKRSLLAGDRVIQAILQPEIRTRVMTLLGKTLYGLVSPTHKCILTNRELITVREEDRRTADDRCGGIWDYIPNELLDRFRELASSDFLTPAPEIR